MRVLPCAGVNCLLYYGRRAVRVEITIGKRVDLMWEGRRDDEIFQIYIIFFFCGVGDKPLLRKCVGHGGARVNQT